MDSKITCHHSNFSTIGEDEKGKDILKCDDCYEIITYEDLTPKPAKSIAEIIDENKTEYVYQSKIDDSDGDDENENAERLQDKIDEDRLSTELNI